MAKKASKSRQKLIGAPLKAYHHQSRDLFSSLILVLPLFLFYQFGVLWTGGVRNGVDFVTESLWWATGESLQGYLLVNGGVLVAFAVSLFVLGKRGTFHPKIWPWVVIESTVYAFFFGGAVFLLMDSLGLGALLSAGGLDALSLSTFDALVLSIGAGLYEELVFRLLLMGGLWYGASRWAKWPGWWAALMAVIVSSLAFSAVHHMGGMGEPFVLGVFMFRFFAGMLLAVIFYLRGFAVAVYTHAIYDVFVLVFQ